MALLTHIHDHPLAFSFGLLGNFISVMVYLSPLPTFYRIHRKKSTEGFQSIPYVIALFSAMLWIYYAIFKPHSGLLISINSFGCFIETFYICSFIAYAPKRAKIYTAKILVYLNVGAFGSIVLFTFLIFQGSTRIQIIGWICVGFSMSVFAAPLTIIMKVIRTRSVEYMPFWLSFSLTVSAVIWFLYGLFTKDRYVACTPSKPIQDQKLPERIMDSKTVGLTSIVVAGGGSELHPLETRLGEESVEEEMKPRDPFDRDEEEADGGEPKPSELSDRDVEREAHTGPLEV
ncbi:Bidirectional sugar transporter SWEET14 [Acorus gramineus]|uniref:Bidirectional sugar transporter SWEET n=1 Tax=Acorus gramineus TaxID=55184 RepID=A0AAV9B7M9_ACOGR|nr:Bidirectional sugar transporter SWEET14 [Acorus gramineus]